MIYPYHIPTRKEVEQIIINKNHVQELISGMETLVSFFENKGLDGGELNIAELIINFLKKSYEILNREKVKHTVSNIIIGKRGTIYYLQTFSELISSVSLCYFYEYTSLNDSIQSGIPEGFYVDNVDNIIRAVQGKLPKPTTNSFEITKKKLNYAKSKDDVVFLLSLHKTLIKDIMKDVEKPVLKFQMTKKASLQDLLLMRLFTAITKKSKVIKLSIEDLTIIG